MPEQPEANLPKPSKPADASSVPRPAKAKPGKDERRSTASSRDAEHAVESTSPTIQSTPPQKAAPETTQVDTSAAAKPRLLRDYGSKSMMTREEPAGSMAETLLLGSQQRAVLDLTDCMLGEFRILRRLGSGGMAQVYLAEQTSLKRNVAVKVMRPDFGDDETLRARFEHEALAAAGLNHRNIVQVLSVGEQDGVRYIAQEYVLGMNMKQFITKKPPPSAKVAIHLLRQVCAALQVAHDSGIVHRDIKPENIMITAKYVAKVTDFGLAQLTLGGERVNLTNVGTTMGTPLYMSPEQINAANVDHRSDLYSLGIAFYHLLAGEPPFTAPNAYALASKHLHGQAEPLKQLRPDLPSKLTDLIHRLMAKKPDERFPDAKSVLSELKRIERSLEDGDEEESEELDTYSDEDQVPWLRVPKRKLIAYAIACVVVYLLAAGVGREQRRPDPYGFGPRTSARP